MPRVPILLSWLVLAAAAPPPAGTVPLATSTPSPTAAPSAPAASPAEAAPAAPPKKPASRPPSSLADIARSMGLEADEQNLTGDWNPDDPRTVLTVARAHRAGANLIVEVPMTTVPRRKGAQPQKRTRLFWTVVAVPRQEASGKKSSRTAAERTLHAAALLKAQAERAEGVIYVFIDPNVPTAIHQFAELLRSTKRIVKSVDCSGMGQRADACRETFAAWRFATR